MSNKQVLIIGSGVRVQSTVIPALIRLEGEFEIAGIYSRTKKSFAVLGRTFEATDSLVGVDFQALDLIVIAVTLEQVPDVLKKLARYDTAHIRLMLDTPVLAPRDLGSLRLLRRFKSLSVSEDSITLPPFVSARNLIAAGVLGRIKEIRFIHSGYRYHALSAMKMLTGLDYVSRISNKKAKGKTTERHFRFPNGTKGIIIEPRDYSIGQLQIVGEREVFNYDFSKEEILELKIQGLVELITGQKTYSPIEGIYDNLSIMISEKFGRFGDTRLPFAKQSVFHYLIKIISRLLP